MTDDIYAVIEERDDTDTEQKDSGFVAEDAFDKDAWAARKKAEREGAYEMIDDTAARVGSDASEFKAYLDTLARIPAYSTANTLLIFAQRPDATRVGDYEFWKRQEQHVKGGERGITILEPGDEYVREDGSVGISYNTKKLFDVSQTTARRRQAVRYDERTLIKALVANAPAKIETVEALDDRTPAHFDATTNTVSAEKGHGFAELFCALATELSHASLAKGDAAYDRAANDNAAHSAAYVVARRCGIDFVGAERIKVPSLPGGTPQQTRAELSRIHDVSKDISERMDKVLETGRETRTHDRGERDAR
jgi:hypothetical protein